MYSTTTLASCPPNAAAWNEHKTFSVTFMISNHENHKEEPKIYW